MKVDLEFIMISLLVLTYLAGFYTAVLSLFQARTPQGAAAWVLGLITVPFLAVPVFIFFGSRNIRRYGKLNIHEVYGLRENFLSEYYDQNTDDQLEAFLCKTEHPFITGNVLTVLKNGTRIFADMEKEIAKAKNSIFLQTYLFRPDGIGMEFAQLLAQKAKDGLTVRVLYENFTVPLTREIKNLWKESGVVHGFYNPGRRNKLHLNFRNHRKLLLIDGQILYLGGVNIGKEYKGLDPEIGNWRDTNVKIKGPAALIGQLIFAKDWLWARREKLELDWTPGPAAGRSKTIILNSDPGGVRSLNILQHIELINSSKKTLLIANPYIIPPQGILDALMIAKLRGVDVKLLVPGKGDNGIVTYSSEVYYERLMKEGIRIYRHPGMMHQKVLLTDDKMAMVGSSNLDFRSMYINFENGMVSNDEAFVREITEMLEADFSRSEELSLQEFKERSFGLKLRSHLSNVLAPIL